MMVILQWEKSDIKARKRPMEIGELGSNLGLGLWPLGLEKHIQSVPHMFSLFFTKCFIFTPSPHLGSYQVK